MICCVMKAAVMEDPLLKNLSLLYKVQYVWLKIIVLTVVNFAAAASLTSQPLYFYTQIVTTNFELLFV